jgi:hypothetical protein
VRRVRKLKSALNKKTVLTYFLQFSAIFLISGFFDVILYPSFLKLVSSILFFTTITCLTLMFKRFIEKFIKDF